MLLFPYEGWAHPACVTYWVLKTTWWSKKRCKIVEVSGNKKVTTKGKMSDVGNGNMVVTGKFRGGRDHDFKLSLTSNVSNADFQLGYSMTGSFFLFFLLFFSETHAA